MRTKKQTWIKESKYTFELIQNKKGQPLSKYIEDEIQSQKQHLKKNLKQATLLEKNGFEVPLEIIKNSLYYSRNIRCLEKKLKGID
jgi:hypothetical protein